MLHNDDLDAAVGAGVVTQAQADGLLAFAAQRRSGTAALRADEERFRFMRGFNDFFFAIGVVLLGVGISLYAGLNERPAVYAVAAAIMWALAELLVRRMRLVLPGIVILIFFTIFVMSAWPSADTSADPASMSIEQIFHRNEPLQIAIKSAIAMAAAGFFYFRFRFPFALLIAGGGAVLATVLSASVMLFGHTVLPFLLMLLACGLVTFAAAIRFDLSDRLRATRRSDCAFWLHVLAAPLLVHSLIGLVSLRGVDLFKLDSFSSLMIIVIVGLLTIVALVVDRRALLVSALGYIGIVIANTLTHAGTNATGTGIATLLILGTMVLALGIGWAPLRRRVTSLISSTLMDRLPPVVPA